MSSNARPAPATPGRLRRAVPRVRLQLGFVLIAMVLSVFGVRLVQLQGIDPNAYAEMATAKDVVTRTLPATRGDILDRNGLPLAGSVSGKMVVADPLRTTEHAPALAKLLSTELGVDYFSTLERLRKKGSRFEYVARRVPAAQARDVVAAAKNVIAQAKAAGLFAGVNAFHPDQAQDYVDAGADFVNVGADVALLARATEQLAAKWTTVETKTTSY